MVHIHPHAFQVGVNVVLLTYAYIKLGFFMLIRNASIIYRSLAPQTLYVNQNQCQYHSRIACRLYMGLAPKTYQPFQSRQPFMYIYITTKCVNVTYWLANLCKYTAENISTIPESPAFHVYIAHQRVLMWLTGLPTYVCIQHRNVLM